MGLFAECQASLVAYKKPIIGLGVAKFVQNTFFFACYYSVYVKPLPAAACEDTWWAIGAQSLNDGPLLGVAIIGYLMGTCCESFCLFLFFFLIHAFLGLFVYTPLIVITGSNLLTGDGVVCYDSNPDAHFVIFTYLLETWLYTTYTAMMCFILYLSIGKVLLAKCFPPALL